MSGKYAGESREGFLRLVFVITRNEDQVLALSRPALTLIDERPRQDRGAARL